MQQSKKIAIQQVFLLQRLGFTKGDFCKTAVFKSYGMKTKQNWIGLPEPQSAQWGHPMLQQRAGMKSHNN